MDTVSYLQDFLHASFNLSSDSPGLGGAWYTGIMPTALYLTPLALTVWLFCKLTNGYVLCMSVFAITPFETVFWSDTAQC